MRLRIQKGARYLISSQEGLALILTLVILTILTAMTIEFSYSVYTTTSSLKNWQESQRLYLASRSGLSLAVKTISEIPQNELYRLPVKIAIPVSDILSDFQGNIIVNVEDENSRFNLNSIINENQTLNRDAYNVFRRLLKNLGLQEELSDNVADWIDKDSEPRRLDTEENAKNSYMESPDELLFIKGFNYEIYNKIAPYVTVYPVDRSNPQLININTASEPVIMSITDGITKEMAQRIINARPFERISDVEKVVQGLGLGPTKVVVRPVNFRIISIAEENKVKKLIESVVEIRGNSRFIRYWKET